MPIVRSFTILPALPEPLKDLEILARNMFWCWNLDLVRLFKRIDSKLWKSCGYNPVRLLARVSQDTLDELTKNQSFLSELQRASQKLNSYLDERTWFDGQFGDKPKPTVAYFSAEFGIHESLPVYSGGLGILAGDHLKSASDLGIPLIGVGLLYQKGYFRQYLNIDGWQQEAYVASDFCNMPVELVRDEEKKPLTISIQYPNENVHAQIWSLNIGRIKAYLLDTNVESNSPEGRIITANLYGGDRQMRIRQEIMLGIGGLKALSALGLKPDVCHMNEGHAAFLALERIRELVQNENMKFSEAVEATKSGNIFTVHTPVKAGNDEFPPEMMEKYFGSYFPKLGISKQEFMSLGRIVADDEKEAFKMPVLAIKLSSYRNGVSKLHGEVSRKMWSALWPSVPVNEVPIKSITNGVHIGSWLSEELNTLYERYLGPNWMAEPVDSHVWDNIDQIPDEELWRPHMRSKVGLIAFARNRLKAQMRRRGTYHTELNWAEEVLDPEALTIGFARRFATYKRGNLLLKDPARLIKILNNPEKPVQIIFAGKAHPKDTEGKEIIRQIMHFANQYDVRRRVVFLEDYDMNVARYMVRGVDIWLNNPRRPMEASGTSGMKSSLNGALNMSTLDGWWCEGYRPEGGWVIGAGESYEDAGYQDAVESQAIYKMLEHEIVPLFYCRSADDLPRAWIRKMKNSMKWILPRFNTCRMLREYTEKFYIPAAAKWQDLFVDNMSKAKALSVWNCELKNSWPQLEIKDVQVTYQNGNGQTKFDPAKSQLTVGSQLTIKALVKLGKIKPEDVSVELYKGPVDSWGNIREGSAVVMDYQQAPDNSGNGNCCFSTIMPCDRSGKMGIAVRVLPKNEDLATPFEPGLILWESQTGYKK